MIGDRIQDARERSGILRRDLAKIAGVATETICSIETGRTRNPSFTTVARISAALGLSLDELAKPASNLSISGLDLVRHLANLHEFGL